MSSVIDEFLIQLGIDTRAANAGIKKTLDQLRKVDEEQEKGNKESQRGWKETAESVSKAKNALLGFGLAVVGAASIGDFLTKMVGGNQLLGQQAELFGMNIKELDAYQHAVVAFGGNADSFNRAMQTIEGALAAAKMGMGGKDVQIALAQLGLASNVTPKVKDLAAALKRLKDEQGTQLAFTFAQRLGIDQGLFFMMTEYGENLDALINKFKGYSDASDDAAKAAGRIKMQWAEARAQGDALGQTIQDILSPVLISIAKKLNWFMQGMFWGAIKDNKDRAAAEDPGEKTAGPASSASGGVPRGLRNFNPGNIKYDTPFAKEHGATGKDSAGFAIFPDMATGEKAMSDLLASYKSKGLDTIAAIIARWAPPNENDTGAYIAEVSKRTGLDANAHLRPDQYPAVQNAISIHENGSGYARMVGPQANAPVTAASNSTNVETNIGSLTVTTNATDADGMARGARQALQNTALIGAGIVGAN